MITGLKKHLIVIILPVLIFPSQKSSAQYEADFFKAGINDGMKLIEAYIEPFANAFGAGFNSSWYNTAKTHKFGGFDLTLSVSAAFVPESVTQFDLSDVNFSRLELVDPSGITLTPTIAGPDQMGPALRAMGTHPSLPGTEIELVNFNAPPGTGIGIVPAPMLQAGIGLPLASEIKLRYIPNTPIDEGSLGLIGGGFVKSISEHIKAFRLLPVNISVFGAYCKLSGSIPLSIQPESYANYEYYSFSDFTDQYFFADVTAWNISLLGSVDVMVITGYAGLGYSKTRTHMKLDGFIPLPTIDPSISASDPVYTDAGVVEDVEAVNIENYSGLRFNIGGRVKLAVFTIHVDYTYANYNVLTAGIGISFR